MASVNRDFAIPTGLFTNKNMLDNSAMQVAQRGASAQNITAAGYFTADRWYINLATLGTWTQSVENDAPSGSGLRKSLKMLCTTADATPAATDQIRLETRIEGQDLQRIAKGTSSAQQMALSFWVKANVTGTYVVFLYDADNVRQFSQSYTISSSATWEKKTIIIPADLTGAYDNDENASLYVCFYLAAGSNFQSGSLATSWASYIEGNSAVGQVNVASAINNYWQITGVQLETGSVATALEFRPYGNELQKCQRYFQQCRHVVTPCANGGFGNSYATHLPFVTELRTQTGTTLTTYPNSDYVGTAGNATFYAGAAGTDTAASIETLSTSGFSIRRQGTNTYTLVLFSYKVSADL